MAEYYPTAPQVVEPVATQSEVNHDTRELETMISHFEEIVELPANGPRYPTYHSSIVATGKRGRAPGELDIPWGVAIHEDTHEIFVTDNDSVEVFSEMGEYLYQLGVRELYEPFGIAIHRDNVYVSCMEFDSVNKFSLIEMCLVRRIGGRGSNNGQFESPFQLTTDSIGRVLIADTENHRICIHDPDLNHLRNITHQSMSRPYDVKVSRDRLYVLCPDDNPCMHILTLEGDMLHSLITSEGEMSVVYPRYFCFDPLNNFVINDFKSHSIRVFSPEGNLLHTIGREGDQQTTFYYRRGVVITPNGKLICVSSDDENYGVEMFY